MSFIIDATGGYPSGVQFSPFLDVTARPATEAPVTALYLRGSSVAARQPPLGHVAQHCTYRNLCCTGCADKVPAWHFTDGLVASLTEQARGGVRQV